MLFIDGPADHHHHHVIGDGRGQPQNHSITRRDTAAAMGVPRFAQSGNSLRRAFCRPPASKLSGDTSVQTAPAGRHRHRASRTTRYRGCGLAMTCWRMMNSEGSEAARPFDAALLLSHFHSPAAVAQRLKTYCALEIGLGRERMCCNAGAKAHGRSRTRARRASFHQRQMPSARSLLSTMA